jgi:hypothetical protein
MTYKNCNHLDKNYIFFNGAFDREKNTATFCCADPSQLIAITLHENPEETVQAYQARKHEIISNEPAHNKYHAACSQCASFCERDDWQDGTDKQFHYISINANPSPCQAKCIYCSSNLENRRKFNKELDTPSWELIFKHIQYFRENNLIHPQVEWIISAGEITVHPFKDKIYEAVACDFAGWLSNVYIYSEEITQNLKANPKSYLLTSLDAGTAKTWNKIKGKDNFLEVKNNIRQYAANAYNPVYQIKLKYIVLPGINTDMKNMNAFIQFLLELGIRDILIAKNRSAPFDEEYLRAVTLLSILAIQNNLTPYYFFFTEEHCKKIRESVSMTLFLHKM